MSCTCATGSPLPSCFTTLKFKSSELVADTIILLVKIPNGDIVSYECENVNGDITVAVDSALFAEATTLTLTDSEVYGAQYLFLFDDFEASCVDMPPSERVIENGKIKKFEEVELIANAEDVIIPIPPCPCFDADVNVLTVVEPVNAEIVAGDTINEFAGKTQGQLDHIYILIGEIPPPTPEFDPAIDVVGIISNLAGLIATGDTIQQGFSKAQTQLSALNTAVSNKATIGGDSKASTVSLGSNDAQASALRSNGVDRLIVDINGNVTQAGSATLFNSVILRVRNNVGTFLEVFSSASANVLKFGVGWLEVDTVVGWTQLKGAKNRMVEVLPTGAMGATEEFYPKYIYSVGVITILGTPANWTGNVYTGASLATYELYTGQIAYDASYRYEMKTPLVPTRTALV